MLIKAIKDDISDIHIEPQENVYRVRLRHDGVLRPFIKIPRLSGIKLTAVLKTMADMNIPERRARQEGRIVSTFLRQNPDVMLIGETRDPETGKASMEAAQTGHLVLTILHANNSASSITRFIDMEVPHYLMTSSLLGVLSQRLVRRPCTECSVSRPVNMQKTKKNCAFALAAKEKATRAASASMNWCLYSPPHQRRHS